jgi:hypothetical protein
MGYWSDRAIELEEERAWARLLLCEVGALKECEYHDTFFAGGANVEDAYKLMNTRVSSGQIALDPGQTRSDLTDLIKAVYVENSGMSSCPICDKNLGPD